MGARGVPRLTQLSFSQSHRTKNQLSGDGGLGFAIREALHLHQPALGAHEGLNIVPFKVHQFADWRR